MARLDDLLNVLLVCLDLLVHTSLTYNNVSALFGLSILCLLCAMSYTATKDECSWTNHERDYLNNVHFSNYFTRDCHVTRTEVVTTWGRSGVDTNGNVNWIEVNWMRIQKSHHGECAFKLVLVWKGLKDNNEAVRNSQPGSCKPREKYVKRTPKLWDVAVSAQAHIRN